MFSIVMALLVAASTDGEPVEHPRLIASVHLYPMTSFPDLLGASATLHLIPYVDVQGGGSYFPGRVAWWVRGGPRLMIFDKRDEQHRGLTWRVAALAGYRAVSDAKTSAAGFTAMVSTDIAHFFAPHLGLSIQAAMGAVYDDPAKRWLPELRVGVGLAF